MNIYIHFDHNPMTNKKFDEEESTYLKSFENMKNS